MTTTPLLMQYYVGPDKEGSALIMHLSGLRLIPLYRLIYVGHVLSAEGLRPDPVKTQGIREMSPPTTRDELETVPGMVTFLGKFAPNLANVTAPLRDVTKKEV